MVLYLLSIAAWSQIFLIKVEKYPPCHPVFYELDPWCHARGNKHIESGSGFLWDGNIWTSHHLVAGAFSLGIMLDNSILSAEIIQRSPRRDFAILKSNITQPSYVTASLPQIGDKIVCSGYAQGQTLLKNLGAVLEINITITIFDMEMHNLLKLSCPSLPGMSGGPVLNDRGELIAMLLASDQKDISYALPLKYLKNNL